jgi:hypothetical protein
MAIMLRGLSDRFSTVGLLVWPSAIMAAFWLRGDTYRPNLEKESMRNAILRIAAGASLLLLPACLPGFGQAPIAGAFLGTSPVTLTQPPVAAEDVSGFGVDADGDYFYADKVAGTITKVASDGSRSVVLSGLKQARIAVDYRGDVYVADTGNNRVLALSAGSTVPRVISGIAAPGSIAADVSNDYFYISGNNVYQVIRNAGPRKIGTFVGASLLAYGPATGEDDTLYVLSVTGAGGAAMCSVSTYTYHNGVGTFSTGQSFPCKQTLTGFAVDQSRNLIFSAEATEATSYVWQVSASGLQTAITSPVSGVSTELALDYNRNLLYVDRAGVHEVMKSAVNFGSEFAFVYDQFESGVTATAMFALPPGAASTVMTSYMGGNTSDFFDNFTGSGDCNADGSVCTVPLVFLPQNMGMESSLLALVDGSGAVLAQVRLYGVGTNAYHWLYQANGTANPETILVAPPGPAPLKAPAGIAVTNGDDFPFLLTDVGTGSLVDYYNPGLNITGLGTPQTVAHDQTGVSYVTQSGLAGVLTINSKGAQTRVAERLVTEPNDVALDDAGNLYIADRSSVFRVGTDGTETELADNDTDGGYERVESIAVQGDGDVYAFFNYGGPGGNGGLVKITPGGLVTAVTVPETVKSATAMALDPGGGLYISDGITRTLNSVRTDGSALTMLSGLKKPKGVNALGLPLVVDQGASMVYFPGTQANAFSFGNVAVGSSATQTFEIFALGNIASGGYYQSGGLPFTVTGGNYSIQPGGSQTMTVTFTPTAPGPTGGSLCYVSNDNNRPDEEFGCFPLTGTGVTAAH